MKRPIKKTIPTLKGEPVYSYISVCCSERATKPPCVKVDAKSAETQGLGTWRCGKCRKVCKCSRSKNVLDKHPVQE